MANDNQFPELGHELGYEGIEQLVDQVDGVCTYERERIELTNESRIIGLRIELAMWSEEEKRIVNRMRLAPPPGDRRWRRRKAWLAAAVAVFLTVAGFFFSVLAFEPFRLGWKSYLYCFGIAVVSPFLVERCLEEWDRRKLVKTFVTVACLAAIASLILLAVIRGELIAQELRQAEEQVIVTGDNSSTPRDDSSFYSETLPLLQCVMAFLAVAMELGAGLALHDAARLGADSGEDSEKLAMNLREIRMRIAGLLSQAKDLSNEGAAFEKRFWRDFYRVMLTHASRKALGKLLVVSLCLLLTQFGIAEAQTDRQHGNIVVLIDLSASVASRGPDGTTDFEKNVAAVTELLAHVPAGSHVTIVGITANSFSEPDILVQAEVPTDVGYFGERLTAAHRQLIRAWEKRMSHVTPAAKQTDILGALLVASQFFAEASSGDKKALVIYSDMRQATGTINLERNSQIAIGPTLEKTKRSGLVARLPGVDVYVIGADAAGKGAVIWETLKGFWAAYFKEATSNLRDYSVLRNIPNF